MKYQVSVAPILQQVGAEFRISSEFPFPQVARGSEIFPLTEPVRVDLTVQNTGVALRVWGDLNATVQTECARCLEPVQLRIVSEVDELFYLEGEAAEEEDYRLEAEALDLEELIRETLLLAIPVSGVCKEDCSGICQQCGQNLNEGTCDCSPMDIDPRWEALKDWKG